MAVEDCNCMSLRRAARRVSNFYDAVLSPSGVRATQYSMLALLGEVGALSINDLASRLDLDRTTTGKNLQPLVTTRLVKIARSSAEWQASPSAVPTRCGVRGRCGARPRSSSSGPTAKDSREIFAPCCGA
jgi:hypothetical protein